MGVTALTTECWKYPTVQIASEGRETQLTSQVKVSVKTRKETKLVKLLPLTGGNHGISCNGSLVE